GGEATGDAVAEALFGGPAAAGRAAAPSGWLDPAAGVVRVRRRPEAADLVRWCRTASAPVLRLVCGPGGQGKTQLAEQVCRELRRPAAGWLAGFVRLPAVGWRGGGGGGRPGAGPGGGGAGGGGAVGGGGRGVRRRGAADAGRSWRAAGGRLCRGRPRARLGAAAGGGVPDLAAVGSACGAGADPAAGPGRAGLVAECHRPGRAGLGRAPAAAAAAAAAGAGNLTAGRGRHHQDTVDRGGRGVHRPGGPRPPAA